MWKEDFLINFKKHILLKTVIITFCCLFFFIVFSIPLNDLIIILVVIVFIQQLLKFGENSNVSICDWESIGNKKRFCPFCGKKIKNV
jgi:hypothetical protein